MEKLLKVLDEARGKLAGAKHIVTLIVYDDYEDRMSILISEGSSVRDAANACGVAYAALTKDGPSA